MKTTSTAMQIVQGMYLKKKYDLYEPRPMRFTRPR